MNVGRPGTPAGQVRKAALLIAGRKRQEAFGERLAWLGRRWICTDVAALHHAVADGGADLVLAEPQDAGGVSVLPELVRLRAADPHLQVIVLYDHTRPFVRAVAPLVAARAGFDFVATPGPYFDLLARYGQLARARALAGPAELLWRPMMAVALGTAVRRFVASAILAPSGELSVPGLARRCRVPARTVQRYLRRGGASPSLVLRACLAFHGAYWGNLLPRRASLIAPALDTSPRHLRRAMRQALGGSVTMLLGMSDLEMLARRAVQWIHTEAARRRDVLAARRRPSSPAPAILRFRLDPQALATAADDRVMLLNPSLAPKVTLDALAGRVFALLCRGLSAAETERWLIEHLGISAERAATVVATTVRRLVRLNLVDVMDSDGSGTS